MEKWLFLAGAWLCAFGFVLAGLACFCAGSVPGLMRRDGFALAFMCANVAALARQI